MSTKNNFYFSEINKEKILSLTSIREGEVKLGQTFTDDYTNADFVIIGIKEDIGPQANLGLPGSKNAFDSFLTRFVNMQENRFLKGETICVLGEIISESNFKDVQTSRELIEELDELVFSIVAPIIKNGKIPILIGGGHNNAYPLIHAAFSSKNKGVNVINLDPHADCRAIEGRHSGNPFSYAKKDNFLNHYTVLGLHQQYNNESMLQYLDDNGFTYTFYEDYLFNQRNLIQDIQQFITESSKESIGIELDLDSIAYMPSSAFSPSGFSVEVARNFIHYTAKHKNINYLHLPEGAPLSSKEEKIVGKTLSYLVSDFVKSKTSN